MNFQLLIILCGLSQTFGDGPCIYEHHYCNPTAFDLIRKVTEVIIEDRSECEAKCTESSDDGEECTHYTFFKFRGVKTCFLLAGCNDKKQKCPEQGTCESGAIGGDGCIGPIGGFCDKITPDKVRWRCKNGINPYKDTVPVGTPCYTYCPNWLNEDGDVFAVKSLCEGNRTWGTPKLFPPKPPPKYLKAENIKKPDENWDEHGCHEENVNGTAKPCNALKLTYNPNEEAGAMFHCDTPVNWNDIETGGVKIEDTNRCHFFCEKMLISITECKDGIWEGGHNMGYWCLDKNEKPPLDYWGGNSTIEPDTTTTTPDTITTTPDTTTTTPNKTADCDEGWTLFDHNEMCYKSFFSPRVRKIWTAARQHCQTLGADLASVNDQETNDFLKSSTMMKGQMKQFWLGGVYRVADAKWEWSDESTWGEHLNWDTDAGKPNHADDNDDYLLMMGTGKWHDWPRPGPKKPYFCQKKHDE